MRHRITDLDARLGEAKARAEDARREADLSHQRYDAIHAKVAEPLTVAGGNGFAGVLQEFFP